MSDKLRMYNASIESKSWYPLKDTPGGKTVLVLSSVLTQDLAAALKARGLCYDDNRTPRQFEGKIGLPITITGAKVELGDRMFESGLIHKFKVGRKENAADNDITLHLTLRAHFTGDQLPHLDEFCRQMNAGEFSFIVDPAQGAFEFAAAKDEAEDAEQEPIEEHLNGAALDDHRTRRGRKRETVGAEA